MVQANGAEILADILERIAEGFGDTAAQFGTVGHRPKREQRLDGRHGRSAGLRVRHESNVLSFWMGPPSAAPNSLRSKGAMFFASKKLRASSALLRKNS